MSKVILSSVLLNVRNIRNFSAVACTKKWDLPSRGRPSVSVKQHWCIPVKSSSPYSYLGSSSSRWCSTGSLSAGLEALPHSIPSPPTGAATSVFDNLPSIPAPPQLAPPVEKILELAQNGEPTLASIGLGGWWPKGLYEEAFMAIHVHLGLPWWGTIALGALVMRCFMFPLTVKSQRATTKMAVYMPKITEAYDKMTEARKQDDPYLVYKYSKQVEELQKKGGSPFSSLLPGIVQFPFIYCFFSALREMSSAPVESFKTGGALWFTDLTTRDEYYGLPILCSLGLFAVLQLSHQQLAAIKFGPYVPYLAAPVSFFICMFFTNAVAVYWVTASVLNFTQALILRQPLVREKLKLGPIVAKRPLKKKGSEGFFKDIKKNMDNSRIAREVEDRYRLDAIAFEKAGREPVKKTYPIDPTKSTLSKS